LQLRRSLAVHVSVGCLSMLLRAKVQSPPKWVSLCITPCN